MGNVRVQTLQAARLPHCGRPCPQGRPPWRGNEPQGGRHYPKQSARHPTHVGSSPGLRWRPPPAASRWWRGCLLSAGGCRGAPVRRRRSRSACVSVCHHNLGVPSRRRRPATLTKPSSRARPRWRPPPAGGAALCPSWRNVPAEAPITPAWLSWRPPPAASRWWRRGPSAARQSGVHPFGRGRSTFAPAFRRATTTSECPPKVALCSADHPSGPLPPCSRPPSRTGAMAAVWPRVAAMYSWSAHYREPVHAGARLQEGRNCGCALRGEVGRAPNRPAAGPRSHQRWGGPRRPWRRC